MTNELATTYDPKAVEQQVYKLWVETGAFNAEPDDSGEPYCIVIPPPNVTAALHAGHALNNSLQDVLIRWRRMQGRNTLWMPGTDHAGIATQTVVEKRLLAEEGKKRTDYERDEFIARVQAWKDQYEKQIIGQLKTMGCSCDWRRTRFTMDEMCAKAVRANFFKLFCDGLIYRGKRLVNWDPATQTVLADDEVEHEDVHGHFWYMQYPLVEAVEIDGKRIDHVTVATTRPETMLGDTAVAMNPSDPRAKALVGKQVRLPIVGRIIPIIADDHVVLADPESDDEKARFSTGFLKVTPAHDLDDYQIGMRHDLPMINVMAPDGSISDRHGWEDATAPEAQNLLGMDRFEARKAIVEWFKTEKLMEDVREYVHPVGHSYRSHVPIEPYLSDQWYIAVKKQIPGKEDAGLIEGTDLPVNSLAGLALKPLLDGRLKFTPDRYEKTYQAWLENLRDWPISRQLWWGHRIPIWYTHIDVSGSVMGNEAISTDEIEDKYVEEFYSVFDDFIKCAGLENRVLIMASNNPSTHYICPLDKQGDLLLEEFAAYRNEDPFELPSFPKCSKSATKLKGYMNRVDREDDVLDTWFSSALWPFSTLGWPEKTPELDTYYPGNVLCTAREIITLWVSRMVMMGQYCLGDIPFTDVFIHAMLQDGQGRKMSKSLGNGIDPLDIIDSHGADAMRLTLVGMTTQTQDVRVPVEELTLPDGRKVNSSPKFDLGRNFCNKLWNAARFAMMNLTDMPAWADIDPAAELSDRWILSRLNRTVAEATASLEAFKFNELADTLYHFMWDDFCDWYLEIAKNRINAGQAAPKAIVAHCLDTLLRLLHPIMPFITEAIWAKLNEIAPARGPLEAKASELLVKAVWPEADAAAIDETSEAQFSQFAELIRQIRNVKTAHNVPTSKRVDAVAEVAGPAAELFAANLDLVASQARLGEIKISPTPAGPYADAAAVAAGPIKLYVLGIIDRQAEIKRLTKKADELTRGVKGIQAKLASDGFVNKAPAEVVQKERERLEPLRMELAAANKAIEALQKS